VASKSCARSRCGSPRADHDGPIPRRHFRLRRSAPAPGEPPGRMASTWTRRLPSSGRAARSSGVVVASTVAGAIDSATEARRATSFMRSASRWSAWPSCGLPWTRWPGGRSSSNSNGRARSCRLQRAIAQDLETRRSSFAQNMIVRRSSRAALHPQFQLIAADGCRSIAAILWQYVDGQRTTEDLDVEADMRAASCSA
jgi:hypothetical protein